jgi:hypothetical protein
MAVENTLPQDIAPLGIFLHSRGVDISNNLVGIDKNDFFVPAVKD